MAETGIIQDLYPKGGKRFIIVFTATLAAVLQMIDTTIVNVALRQISGSIGASTSEIAWVITSYAISNVIIIPLSGMLSNLFGRKRYFTMSIALFTIASLMCGFSNSLWTLVFWRFVQGIGGGALLATSQAIIAEAFPPKKLATGMAIFGSGIAMGPAFGPLLGGYLTDNLSWNWIFFVNVPLGILAIIFSWFFIADEKERYKIMQLDWWGIVFLAIGVGSLQYVLEEGNAHDWFESKTILFMSAISIAGIIAFIYKELKILNPSVDLSLFRIPNITLGAILNFVIGAVLFGVLYSYPLFTQMGIGWNATKTGLSIMPGALITAVGFMITQKLSKKGVNPKVFILIGLFLTIIFCFQMYYQSPGSNWDSLFWPMFIRGLGMSFLMLPIITISVEGLKGYELAQGTGISNMARQLGGAFGLALINIRITHSFAFFRNKLVANINDIDRVPVETIQGMTKMIAANGYCQPEAQTMAMKLLDYSVTKQTIILGFLDSFLVVGIACIALIPLVFLMRHSNEASSTDISASAMH